MPEKKIPFAKPDRRMVKLALGLLRDQLAERPKAKTRPGKSVSPSAAKDRD